MVHESARHPCDRAAHAVPGPGRANSSRDAYIRALRDADADIDPYTDDNPDKNAHRNQNAKYDDDAECNRLAYSDVLADAELDPDGHANADGCCNGYSYPYCHNATKCDAYSIAKPNAHTYGWSDANRNAAGNGGRDDYAGCAAFTKRIAERYGYPHTNAYSNCNTNSNRHRHTRSKPDAYTLSRNDGSALPSLSTDRCANASSCIRDMTR